MKVMGHKKVIDTSSVVVDEFKMESSSLPAVVFYRAQCERGVKWMDNTMRNITELYEWEIENATLLRGSLERDYKEWLKEQEK